MKQIPPAFEGLTRYRQFITYMLVPSVSRPGSVDKIPINPFTLEPTNPHDPNNWMSAAAAIEQAHKCPADVGVGFVFTRHDPFFFLDIDKCLTPEGHWSALAQSLMDAFRGAAFEVSQSGKGLHIIGSGACPPHSCKNTSHGIELYTEARFVALTGDFTEGSVEQSMTPQLQWLVTNYFSKAIRHDEDPDLWNHEPVAEWNGPMDDDVLINKAMSTVGVANVFGGKASFQDLFEANVHVLAAAYPSSSGKPFDESSADMALACHLAFWTGKNHERIKNIMVRSALARGKWDREQYMRETIRNACSLQANVYSMSYKAGGPAAAPIQAVPREQTTQLVSAIPASMLPAVTGSREMAQVPEISAGAQYMPASEQPEYFKGCIYIRNSHSVLVPDGTMLKPDVFRAMYSGYDFALDLSNSKKTKSAWEAFIESQAFKFPKANRHVFRPELPPLKIFAEEGETVVNSYVPVDTPRRIGNPAPFLDLLAKLLPNLRDQQILLSYMAACVQYPGAKFQWCPILQGCEGNGKTTLVRCVAFAIGKKYSHTPNVLDIANKFNGWIAEKLFIGIDEIYTQDKQELLTTLYPMITNDVLEVQIKGREKQVIDNRANFFMTTNHEDAIKVTEDTRRWCMFFTAQQSKKDKERCGMGGSYFPHLYRWLRAEGYEIVNDYLRTYIIQDEFNPAGVCIEAPATSAYIKASDIGKGRIEQEVLEAVAMGMQGFRGNWMSSVVLDKFLRDRHLDRFVPHVKRRKFLVSLGYDYHPALPGGRATLPIIQEGNNRPLLYCRMDAVPFAQDPIDARNRYMYDQGYAQS